MKKHSWFAPVFAGVRKAGVIFFAALGAVAAGAGEAVSIAPDGNFVRDGKPVFLLGPVAMNDPYYQYAKDLHRGVPKEWQWLYNENVSDEQILRLGGGIWPTGPNRTFLHIFDPEAKVPAADRQAALEHFIDRYQGKEFYSKIRWMAYHTSGPEFYRRGFRDYEAVMRQMKLPLYVELGGLYWLWQRPDMFSDCIPGKAFNPTTAASMFSLGFSLVTPEGREQYRKAYRYNAEIFRDYGVKVLCYELFNEAKYAESSPEADQAFLNHLKRKFRTLKELNRAWGSSYAAWEDVLKRWTHGKEIEERMFAEDLTTDFVRVLRDDIRRISPESGVTVQLHGGDDLRTLWHGFNFRKLAGVVDWINSGTGNSNYANLDGKAEQEPILENANAEQYLRYSILAAKLCLAAAGNKPIVNNEVYTGNRYDSIFNTIWTEAIRGRNSSHIFCFVKRDWRMSLEKDAEQFPYHMLNRFYVKPDDLRAMPDAGKEIDSLASFILPRANRTPAQVAVLHSFTTVRAGGEWQKRHGEIYTAAMGLEFTHLPWMPIFEEDLKEQLDRFQVLIAEGVSCVLPETEAILERFVRNGGILIAGLDPMNRDVYCREKGSKLFSFTLAPHRGKPETRRLEGGILAFPVKEIRQADGWQTVLKSGDEPVVITRNLGKGKIFFHSWKMNDYGTGELLRRILAEHGITPQIEIRKELRDELSGDVEFHEFRSGGMTIWYLMNCDPFAKIVRLKSPRLKGAVAQEIFDAKQRLPRQGEDEVIAFLPSQRRVLLAVAPQAAVEQQFGKGAPVTGEAFRAKLAESRRTETAAAAAKKPGTPVDLKPYCNQGFDNQQGYQNRIAWQEGKESGLKGVPFDRFYAGGYPVEPIRYDFNNNNTTIALKSHANPEGLEAVRNIPLHRKVQSLTFFHAVTGAVPGSVSHLYRIHYADGSSVDLPNVVGREIGSWILERNTPEMLQQVAWQNHYGKGFFFRNWKNPRPEQTVEGFDILAPEKAQESDQTALVVAVTAEEYREFQKLSLPAGWKAVTGEKRSQKPNRLQVKSSVTLSGPEWKIPPEIQQSAHLSFEVNQIPDAWGSSSSVSKLPRIVLHWMDAEGREGDTHAESECRERAWSWVNQHYRIDLDKATFQTIRIPLSLFLPSNSGAGIIQIRSWHNNPNELEIRDLRIEY